MHYPLNARLDGTLWGKLMDAVDDYDGTFVEIDELSITESDKTLIRQATKRFSSKMRYFVVTRGLSSAMKVVAKPQSLFPLLIKLDSAESIRREVLGDELLRDRIPPTSIPPLDGVYYHDGRGALAYRYVTGGRVRDIARRLDVEMGNLSTYRILKIIDDVFDVILKKCHWLDGLYEMKFIQLPNIYADTSLNTDPKWIELMRIFNLVKNMVANVSAPHGIIHGDLHAKNILITRDDAPILIDFSFAKSDVCQYHDYAKLETTLQFQVDGKIADEMWRIQELIYGTTSLIVPHSNRKLANCVHRIRSNLWQGCTRKSLAMNNSEVEIGYAAFLFYNLTKLYSKIDNSMDTRNRCFNQAKSLSALFE